MGPRARGTRPVTGEVWGCLLRRKYLALGFLDIRHGAIISQKALTVNSLVSRLRRRVFTGREGSHRFHIVFPSTLAVHKVCQIPSIAPVAGILTEIAGGVRAAEARAWVQISGTGSVSSGMLQNLCESQFTHL